MSVVSLSFIGFFLITLLLYYCLPPKKQWIILLISSVIFYFCSATGYTFLYVVVSIFSIYGATVYIENEKAKHRKAVYMSALIINVGMLAVLKYMNFFVGNAKALVHIFVPGVTTEVTTLVASLGVSFYALWMIGYLTDVYWGMYPAQKNPFKLALFNCYYPQMISGPFSRYGELSKTLYEGKKFSFDTLGRGFSRIIIGFFKKLVISEQLVGLVDAIYADYATYGGVYIWIATILYILQIYADFSGCMDIVFGVSECYGVILPENFRAPFVSTSIQEFWQRWHITLGTWLKDYIMYPILRSKAWNKMGKNIKKKYGKKAAKMIPTFLGMLVLWLAMGLWHGGGWNYIGEGIWFWAIIVLGQVMEPVFDKWMDFFHLSKEKRGFIFFQRIRTIFIYGVGALFFKAGTLTNAIKMLASAFSPMEWVRTVKDFIPTVYNTMEMVGTAQFLWSAISVCIGFVVMIWMGHIQMKQEDFRNWVATKPVFVRCFVWYVFLMMIMLFGAYGMGYSASSFIYGGF